MLNQKEENLGLHVLVYTDLGEGKGIGFIVTRPPTWEDIQNWIDKNTKTELQKKENQNGTINMV